MMYGRCFFLSLTAVFASQLMIGNFACIFTVAPIFVWRWRRQILQPFGPMKSLDSKWPAKAPTPVSLWKRGWGDEVIKNHPQKFNHCFVKNNFFIALMVDLPVAICFHFLYLCDVRNNCCQHPCITWKYQTEIRIHGVCEIKKQGIRTKAQKCPCKVDTRKLWILIPGRK